MEGAVRRLLLTLCVVACAWGLSLNDHVNGTLSPCSAESFSLDTSSSGTGSIQTISVNANSIDVELFDSKNALYDSCLSPCDLVLSCGLADEDTWTVVLSGDNQVPVVYEIDTSSELVHVIELKSGVEQKVTLDTPIDEPYLFFSVSASALSDLTSLNVTVSPAKSVKMILANIGAIPTEEDVSCDPFETHTGTLLVSSCSLQEGTWFVAVEPAPSASPVQFTIVATVGEGNVREVPLSKSGALTGGDVLYSISDPQDIMYFAVPLRDPDDRSLDHMLNVTLLHVQGGELHAELSTSAALPFSGCDHALAACTASFACTDYVRSCAYRDLVDSGAKRVYVGVKLLRKDHEGTPARFSLVVSLDPVREPQELRVDGVVANEAVLQNDLNYYEFFLDDDDDETYVNLYMYGDSLARAHATLFVGTERFDPDGCYTFEWSCDVLPEDGVSACGLQLSTCQASAHKSYFLTVGAGATADATTGFPYTLVLDKRKPRELDTKAYYEEMALVNGGYEHFKVRLDDEDAIRVSLGNVEYGSIEVYLYSEDESLAGDHCSSGQCYQADGDQPYAVFDADGGQFVIQHCACGSPKRMSVRALTDPEHHDRPVSFTLSSIRAADGDIDVKDLDEDGRVTALIGGTAFRRDLAYYEFDASFDDNDEVVLSLTVNDFVDAPPDDVVELTLFAGSGKNVFCESCAQDLSCAVHPGAAPFCTIVLQPCMYDDKSLERSHVRVAATTATAHQFELSLETRSLDAQTLSNGEAEVGEVGVDQYRHFRIRYPRADDDADLTGQYALLVELYLDQAADTTASLFVNPDAPAGDFSECFRHVASQRGQEALDLTVDACHIVPEETYYFAVRGDSSATRNAIPFTITARWVPEQVLLLPNTPVSMSLFPSQRVVHRFSVPWPSSTDSGLYAAVSISTVDPVGMYASFGTPETADNSSCCFDVVSRIPVPGDSEVVVPLQQCNGDDFLLLVQPDAGVHVRYVVVLVVSDVGAVDPVPLNAPLDDSVPSMGYHFYELDGEQGPAEDSRVTLQFTNVRGGSITAYVSNEGVASASSCDVLVEPCVAVPGQDGACVVHVSGCAAGYARFVSVYGESDDGGAVYYTLEAQEHTVTTLKDGQRLDRQLVHAAVPEQFMLAVPDLAPYAAYAQPTVKLIVSDITDAESDDVTVSLGTDLCAQPYQLTCESTAACVLYVPACDFAAGHYYAVVSASADNVEFDIEMDVVDVQVAGVVQVGDEVESVEIQSHNYQVFKVAAQREGERYLQETAIHVWATEAKDEFVATVDSAVVVPRCGPSQQCPLGADCTLTVSSCCLQDAGGYFYVTVYNPHSTQYEINVEVQRDTTAEVFSAQLPISATVDVGPGQSVQHWFAVEQPIELAATSLVVSVVEQPQNASAAAATPTAIYIQENALAGADGEPCTGGHLASAAGAGLVSLELFHCDGLRESTYAVAVANNGDAATSYLISIAIDAPTQLELDDEPHTLALDPSAADHWVQYELDVSAMASPFSDLVIEVGPVLGGSAGALSAAINYNYPAGSGGGFCPGHTPDPASTCTVAAGQNATCTLRISVCDYAGTYFLGILNRPAADAVVVAPGFAELLVSVDTITSAPRNVSRDEENYQLFRTDRTVTLDDGSYFEAELRTKHPEALAVSASWGGACPVPVTLECDTDMPASCYFRLFYCELPTPQTIFLSVHTTEEYAISYTTKGPVPTPVHVGDHVEGVFVGVAEPHFFSLALSSSEIAPGTGVRIAVEGGCGDVEMKLNVGALAGGSCAIYEQNEVELTSCALLALLKRGDLSIQLEATSDAYKLYEVPVKYRLSITATTHAAGGQVLPITAGSVASVAKPNTAFVYSVDSLTSYTGDTTITMTIPRGTGAAAAANHSLALLYSFASPANCGDADVGCVVEEGEDACSFTLPACALQEHAAVFLMPPAALVGASLEVQRSNAFVRLIDASFIDYEEYADDDDDANDHPHSFKLKGAVSAGHSEYFRIKQDPYHPLHLFNATVTVTSPAGSGHVHLLASTDAPPDVMCTTTMDMCSTALSASDADADAARACSLFFGQTDREVYYTVARDGDDGPGLVEYTLRFHFAVPLQRTTLLSESERTCTSIPRDGAAYFLADFQRSNETRSATAFTAIEVSTVVAGAYLDVLVNVDGNWATEESFVTELRCSADDPCEMLFACPVLRNVSLAVSASRSAYDTPVTVRWTEREQVVMEMEDGFTYSAWQYYKLQFPALQKDEMLQVQFTPGHPDQRLYADDKRLPGIGSACYQYDCTHDCQFLCRNYRAGQMMYFVVENHDVAPFSIGYRVIAEPSATPLLLDRAQSVSLSRDQVETFEIDVTSLQGQYATLQVLVYGIPHVDHRLAGKLSMWAEPDEAVDPSCADAYTIVDSDPGMLTIPHCTLEKASSVFVSMVVYEQLSSCTDVSFTIKPLSSIPDVVTPLTLGVASSVQLTSAHESAWFSVKVDASALDDDLALVDFTLDGVDGFEVVATLYPPKKNRRCPCSMPFTSDSLFVPPCCAVSGTYYVNVIHLNPRISAGSYALAASVVVPETLLPAEVLPVEAAPSGAARYFAASGHDDRDSISITYEPRADSARLSVWRFDDSECERLSAPVECSVGPCSVEWSWEEVRPDPAPMVIQLEMNGRGAAGDLLWLSDRQNCVDTRDTGMCSDMSVWVGADSGAADALVDGASALYDRLYRQLFCRTACTCEFVSAKCRDVLKEYACELSLPVCASDGYQRPASHKTCRDVEQRCDVSLAALAPGVACEHEWLVQSGDTTPSPPSPPPAPSDGVAPTTPESPRTTTDTDTGSHSGFGTSDRTWDHTLEWVIFGVFTFFFLMILLLAVVAGGMVYMRKRRGSAPAPYAPLEVNYD